MSRDGSGQNPVTARGLTEQLGVRLEHELMLRRRGLIDPVQERLAEQKTLPVEGHLAEFEPTLSRVSTS